MKSENVIKASQTASLLRSDIMEAYRDAIYAHEEFGVMVFADLIDSIAAIETRLSQAVEAVTDEETQS